MSCAEQPAAEGPVTGDAGGFPCQEHENGLGDVLGEMGVADLPSGRGVNH